MFSPREEQGPVSENSALLFIVEKIVKVELYFKGVIVATHLWSLFTHIVYISSSSIVIFQFQTYSHLQK